MACSVADALSATAMMSERNIRTGWTSLRPASKRTMGRGIPGFVTRPGVFHLLLFSRAFVSFPKLAQRFGNARLGETPSPLRRTTTSIAVPRRSRPPPKQSFAPRVRSQSAALTLGTRGEGAQVDDGFDTQLLGRTESFGGRLGGAVEIGGHAVQIGQAGPLDFRRPLRRALRGLQRGGCTERDGDDE